MPDISMRCNRCEAVLAHAFIPDGRADPMTLSLALGDVLMEVFGTEPCIACDGRVGANADGRLRAALLERLPRRRAGRA